MPKIIVKTGTTIDGTYELDLQNFSWRERAYITEVSGTKPPEFIDKWFAIDPKTIIATIAVMMQRAGVTPDIDVLLDSPEDAFEVDYSDLIEAGEVDPPEGEESPSPDSPGESAESPVDAETSG